MYNICSEKCCVIEKNNHSFISQIKQFNCPVTDFFFFFLTKHFKTSPSALLLAIPSDVVHLMVTLRMQDYLLVSSRKDSTLLAYLTLAGGSNSH